MGLGSISRDTKHSYPTFTDDDGFVLSGVGDLVPVLDAAGEAVAADTIADPEDATKKIKVTVYRARDEAAFLRIERWQHAPNDFHWRVLHGDGTTFLYGRNHDARVSQNDNVSSWLLEEVRDHRGNRTVYTYRGDPDPKSAALHISLIQYGPIKTALTGVADWHYSICFDYALRGPDAFVDLPFESALGKPSSRPDAFSSYRSGMLQKTSVLCRNILIYQKIDTPDPVITAAFHLEYSSDPAGEQPANSTTPSTLVAFSRSGYRSDRGQKEHRMMPPLSLAFSKANVTGAFSPLGTAKKDAPLAQEIHSFVDLHGQGLPGLLHHRNASVEYAAPLGQGRYAKPENLAHFPLADIAAPQDFSLLDLQGDGQFQIVSRKAAQAGYYKIDKGGNCAPFAPFPHVQTGSGHGPVEHHDLTGDGRQDSVIFRHEHLVFNASIGTSGDSPPTSCATPKGFPIPGRAGALGFTGIVDVIGDGGAHMVQIRGGEISCWPHLGHGQYGAAIALNFPKELEANPDPKRLFFADVDGTGPTDLIYATAKGFQLFSNLAGTGFKFLRLLPSPVAFSNQCQVQFADVLGTGSQCLILSAPAANGQWRHWFHDFSGGVKANLLVSVDNSMGAIKHIDYESSTILQLEHADQGRPWPKPMHFVTHVTTRIDVIDMIGSASVSSKFDYHHGFYDRAEKEFRGFGYVEEWEETNGTTIGRSPELLPDVSQYWKMFAQGHSACAFKRHWYHTGDTMPSGGLGELPLSTSFSGSGHAYRLGDSQFNGDLSLVSQDDLQSLRRALFGKQLRMETYSAADWEAEPVKAVPFSVTEKNYTIDLLQSAANGQSGSVFATERETLHLIYERQGNDPRVLHELVIESDKFGHPTQHVEIYYPRSSKVAKLLPPKFKKPLSPKLKKQLKTQRVLQAHAELNGYYDTTDGRQIYLHGVSLDHRAFGLSGLVPAVKDGVCAFKDVKDALSNIQDSPNKMPENLALLSWHKVAYWDVDGKTDGPQLAPQLLIYAEYQAVFPEKIKPKHLARRFTADILKNQGGYTLKDGYWWQHAHGTGYFGDEGFFMPKTMSDAAGGDVHFFYDPYWMHTTKVTLPEGAFHKAEIDYYANAPTRQTDHSGKVEETQFDALGAVVAHSVYGQEDGKPAGDKTLDTAWLLDWPELEDVLAQGQDALGPATARHLYNPWDWHTKQRPPWALDITRTRHLSGASLVKPSHLYELSVSYLDGFHKLLETRSLAGSQPDNKADVLALKNPESSSSEQAQQRWHVTGGVLHDGKGHPVHHFLPRFSNQPYYQAAAEIRFSGAYDTFKYDALGRLIRHDRADGLFTLAEVKPWKQVFHDEIDTLPDSGFYHRNTKAKAPKAAQKAAHAAAKFAKTPFEIDVDVRGQHIRSCRNSNTKQKAVTLRTFNNAGHVTSIKDAREVDCADYIHSLSGEVVWSRTRDGGARWVLHDAMGGMRHIWDQQKQAFQLTYDKAHRLTEISLTTGGNKGSLPTQRTIEKREYGGHSPHNLKFNLANQLTKICDESGERRMVSYGLTGAPTQIEDRLLVDPTQKVDWLTPPALLPAETMRLHFDALHRPYLQELPDGSHIALAHDQLGAVTRLRAGLAGQAPIAAIKNTTFNERHQPETTKFGCGVVRQHHYCKKNGQPTGLSAKAGGTTLQDLHYTVDPLGNIMQIADHSHKAKKASPLISAYKYDGLNRLINADVTTTGADNLPLHYCEAFTYDLADNLLTHCHNSKSESWSVTNTIAKKSNRLAKREIDESDNSAPDLTYNVHGCVTKIGVNFTLDWTPFDRVSCVRNGHGAPTISWYTDDTEGVRRHELVMTDPKDGSEAVPISETRHYGPLRIETQYEDGIAHTRHLLDINGPFGTVAVLSSDVIDGTQTNQNLTYLLDDLSGSVWAELDAKGVVTKAKRYTPYGMQIGVAKGEQPSRREHGYSGEMYDPVTGLNDYGARHYAPFLGRWLSPDPAGHIDGHNLYAFCRGNPVSKRDFGGHAGGNVVQPLPANSSAAASSQQNWRRNAQFMLRKEQNWMSRGIEDGATAATGLKGQAVDTLIARFGNSDLTKTIEHIRGTLNDHRESLTPEIHEQLDSIASMQLGKHGVTAAAHLASLVPVAGIALKAIVKKVGHTVLSEKIKLRGVEVAANILAHDDSDLSHAVSHLILAQTNSEGLFDKAKRLWDGGANPLSTAQHLQKLVADGLKTSGLRHEPPGGAVPVSNDPIPATPIHAIEKKKRGFFGKRIQNLNRRIQKKKNAMNSVSPE